MVPQSTFDATVRNMKHLWSAILTELKLLNSLIEH